MPIRILNSSSTTVALNASDDAILRDFSDIVVTNGDGVTFSTTGFQNASLLVQGNILAGDNGVDFDGSSSGGVSSVTVADTGSVVGSNAAIDMVGDAEVTNHGLISSFGNDGIALRGLFFGSALFQDALVTNSGLIEGRTGIDIQDYDEAAVGNTGEIEGGITVFDTNQLLISNGGLISDTGNGTAITLSNVATPGFTNGGTLITNTGTIVGQSGISSINSGRIDIVNEGTITALDRTNPNTLAINLDDGDDSVVNRGLIEGVVFLDGGDDLFDGRGGTVTNFVQGGEGDDTYVIDDPLTDIREFSGQGTDTVVWAGTGSYSLAAAGITNVETLRIAGGSGVSASANADANLVVSGAGSDSLFGLGGNDTLEGNEGADFIDGGTGSDSLLGGAGDDTLISSGTDTVFGGEGDDLVFAGLGLPELLDGGAGDDTLDTSSFNGDYAVNLATGATNFAGESFVNFESLVSGGGDDTLRGTDTANLISGEAGDDRVFGLGGNDLIDGGLGGDRLDGGEGNDTLLGEDGDDRLSGGGGRDLLLGGLGRDFLGGNNGNDRAFGGDGNDTLRGGGGKDSLYGDGDDDVLSGQGGDDLVFGGSGNDVVGGGNGNDLLFGGSGNDDLRGGGGLDTLEGGGGNDALRGQGGSDTYVFSAGFGDDTVLGFGDASGNQDVIDLSALGVDASDTTFAAVTGGTLLTIAGYAGSVFFASAAPDDGDVLF